MSPTSEIIEDTIKLSCPSKTLISKQVYFVTRFNLCVGLKQIYARFYELGLTRDSRVIPGLTVISILSTSNLGLNWD